MALPLQLPVQDGRYYGGPLDNSIQGDVFSHGTDIIVATPIFFSEDKTWTEIGVRCSIGGDGDDVARLGLYEDNGGTPVGGALVFDAGEIDLSTDGLKPLTISQPLQANTWYWRALVSGFDNAFLVGCTATNPDVLTQFIVGLTDLSGRVNGWRANQTYGPLPAVFPSDGAVMFDVTPFIWMRTGV